MNAFAITIRPEYLEICEGDHCAAAILDLFSRWTFGKEKRGTSTWVYKKRTELRDDLMGLFGLSKVAAALIKLRAWGYLNWRENPINRQDKTLQYQFNAQAVNDVLRLLGQSSDNQNESVERLNLIAGELETSASLTDSASECSSDHLADQTPTPARASQGGGGVQSNFQPVSIDSILDQAIRAEALTEADEHESATAIQGNPTIPGVYSPPPVPRAPSPTGDEPTEEETKSSGGTRPVDVPEHAQIFAIPDAEVRGWIEREPARLAAWCAYASGGNGVKSPGGFVRAAMRAGGMPPPKPVRFDNTDGRAYITGELADFIEH